MGILAPGTIIPGSSDPKTLEQVNTLNRIGDPSLDGHIPSSYRGTLLFPDGTLSKDYSKLVKPPARVAEIDAVLAAGSDPSKPSGGYILALNEDGIPISYVGLGMPETQIPTPTATATATPTPTPNLSPTPTPTPKPIPVTAIDAFSNVRFNPPLNSIFNKLYTWKTMQNIQDDIITVENISSKMSLSIKFESLHPSIVVPSEFELPPKQTKRINIKYSPATLEKIIPFEGKFKSGIQIYVRGL